ncbi:MAG TPA: hypothetical protein VH912_05585 [Streptosporangiaceae bacterium]
MLPVLTPTTDVGRAGASGYAKRQGVSLATFTDQLGPILTAETVGKSVVDLALDPARDEGTYLVNPAGLAPAG